jgi:hypothetical protein
MSQNMLMASEILWNVMMDKKLSRNWCMGDQRVMYEARNVVTRIVFSQTREVDVLLSLFLAKRDSHRTSETATKEFAVYH